MKNEGDTIALLTIDQSYNKFIQHIQYIGIDILFKHILPILNGVSCLLFIIIVPVHSLCRAQCTTLLFSHVIFEDEQFLEKSKATGC